MTQESRQTSDAVAAMAARYLSMPMSDLFHRMRLQPEGVAMDLQAMATSLVSQADGPEAGDA